MQRTNDRTGQSLNVTRREFFSWLMAACPWLTARLEGASGDYIGVPLSVAVYHYDDLGRLISATYPSAKPEARRSKTTVVSG